MIVSLVNVKGGVGKTTTAVQIAAAFSNSGLRTLLVDLDPQASATYSLGLSRDEDMATVADLLLEGHAVDEVISELGEGLPDLIAGDLALASADLELARKQQPYRRLAMALAPVRGRYDLIVMDCPPGLSVTTANALVASTAYVVPTQAHQLGLEALESCFLGIEAMRLAKADQPELLGVLLTMVDHRTKFTGQMVESIRKRYGRKVLRTEIPINVKLAMAPASGRSIYDFEGWSAGALAYSRLGAELLRRARGRKLL